MVAYYNEFEPYAAEWLRKLIAAGHIASGDVDERSITEVSADDVRGYAQCHFFAGIGLWSLALRWAGWPDDRPVWTGSCPCQPFSAAGKRDGYDDARHLAPVWLDLVAECRPPAVFGEQVASKDGRHWLASLRAEMEDLGYAVGAADLCAAGVGAPHIRQRLWFGAERVEHAPGARREKTRQPGQSEGRRGMSCAGRGDGGLADADGRNACTEGLQRGGEHRQQPEDCGARGLADADDAGPQGRGERGNGSGERAAGASGVARGLADAQCDERGQERPHISGGGERGGAEGLDERSGGDSASRRPDPSHVDWRDADWLFCRDGKWRPVEPATFPLAHGYPARVGRLRAYGNAICPEVAATFIEAFDYARNVGFCETTNQGEDDNG